MPSFAWYGKHKPVHRDRQCMSCLSLRTSTNRVSPTQEKIDTPSGDSKGATTEIFSDHRQKKVMPAGDVSMSLKSLLSVGPSAPVHTAAYNGQLASLEKMLNQNRAELTIKDEVGRTCVHWAVIADKFDVCRYLLSLDADCLWATDRDGNHALHHCCQSNSLRTLESLCTLLGKDTIKRHMEDENIEGRRPIHLAAQLKEDSLMTWLISNTSPSIEPTDRLGQTPLHVCAASGLTTIAIALLDAGASPNVQDKNGNTPLHLASSQAVESIVATLIRRGAKVVVENQQQKTAMHIATEEGHDNICYILATNGADISIRYQWEGRKQVDTTIQVVSHADRYGYLEDEESNSKKKDRILIGQNGHKAPKSEEKEIEDERVRATKWAPMVSEWQTFVTKKEKVFRKRLVKGLPDCLRGPVWRRIMNCDNWENANPGKYDELKKAPSKKEDNDQIDLDINRSARRHIQFHDRFGKGQVALFNILKSYSVYDSQVGYLQGMSDMAAFLLMHVLEEDVFWMVVELCDNPKFDFRNRFAPNFPMLKQNFWVWEQIFQQTMPRLAQHFRKQGLSTSFYATKWFLTVFLDTFPFKMTIRLWDLFLYMGYDVVYTICLSIMKWFEKMLMVSNFEEIMMLFRQMEEMHEINVDEFIQFIFKNEIKSGKIRKLEQDWKDIPPDQKGGKDGWSTPSGKQLKKK
ncbi:hypothetical protein PROFUN_07266 [Planoprotostelium fungivorum]|uniref:Rab-GAP TBC domain-containing protein n=1 Tax=Planoprotostelium fungivorum TaxID=1890364 RepID=A0A2P6NMD7_9EUKA|nr:hypothetical protein PROFUN_07266 [Planoprotostelium fungivorum]